MDAPPDLRITITDVRRAGYCVSGIRRWFEAQDLDFRAFVKEGLPVETLAATGDGLAARVIAMTVSRGNG